MHYVYMNTSSINLRTATITSIIAVIIMLILYTVTALGMMGDNPVGRGGNYEEPLIVPAGYAFSIWSIIYLGIIAFPIYQLIRRKTGDAAWKKIHLLFAINAVCNGLWLVAASYDWQWISVAIIMIMLITLYIINQLIVERKAAGDQIHYWLERFPMSIYFAWITLATALNFSSALSFYDWDGFGISQEIWTLVIMSVASIIAFLVFRRFREAGYASIVVWAFVALFVKHQGAIVSIAGLSIAIVIVFSILTVSSARSQVSA